MLLLMLLFATVNDLKNALTGYTNNTLWFVNNATNTFKDIVKIYNGMNVRKLFYKQFDLYKNKTLGSLSMIKFNIYTDIKININTTFVDKCAKE